MRGIGEAQDAIAALNLANPPVYEPELELMIRRNIDAGRLSYTTDYREGLHGADFAFLCLDTPVGSDDKPDLVPVYRAVEAVAANATADLIMCVSAQVPVGTCHAFSELLVARRHPYNIKVVYVPEFLRLGSAIDTFKNADRFVIGSDDPAVAQQVAALYAPLGRPIRITDVRSAEMAKHASNTFLALSISFINEVAGLCEALGADVTEVASILKLDRRIGPHAYLSAGIGYAGGTLGRDIQALKELGMQHGVRTDLLRAVDLVNSRRVPDLAQRIKQFEPELKGARVGILGLTYKAGTSTLRRSAALELIDALSCEGAQIAAYDPLARFEELEAKPHFELHNNLQDVAKGAAVIVLMAPWRGIDEVRWRDVAGAMRRPVLVDAGNFLEPSRLIEDGFTYIGVGRHPMVSPH